MRTDRVIRMQQRHNQLRPGLVTQGFTSHQKTIISRLVNQNSTIKRSCLSSFLYSSLSQHRSRTKSSIYSNRLNSGSVRVTVSRAERITLATVRMQMRRTMSPLITICPASKSTLSITAAYTMLVAATFSPENFKTLASGSTLRHWFTQSVQMATMEKLYRASNSVNMRKLSNQSCRSINLMKR